MESTWKELVTKVFIHTSSNHISTSTSNHQRTLLLLTVFKLQSRHQLSLSLLHLQSRFWPESNRRSFLRAHVPCSRTLYKGGTPPKPSGWNSSLVFKVGCVERLERTPYGDWKMVNIKSAAVIAQNEVRNAEVTK